MVKHFRIGLEARSYRWMNIEAYWLKICYKFIWKSGKAIQARCLWNFWNTHNE